MSDKEKREKHAKYMREYYRKKRNKQGYNTAKIYKIYCDENDDVYYGSTTQDLSLRLRQHKSLKYTSREIMKNTYKIELVEEYPCETKKQLNERERYYIENYPCVNTQIPGRTKKEHREQHKEEINDRVREWYKNNKERSYQRTLWRRSFGDERYQNCLLKIKTDLFD